MTNKSISLIHFCILTCRPTYSTGYLASPLGCPIYTSNKAWLNTELLIFTPKPPLLFLWWVASPSTHWLMTRLRINTWYFIFHIFQTLSLTHSCQYYFLNKFCINPSPPSMCSGFMSQHYPNESFLLLCFPNSSTALPAKVSFKTVQPSCSPAYNTLKGLHYPKEKVHGI